MRYIFIILIKKYKKNKLFDRDAFKVDHLTEQLISIDQKIKDNQEDDHFRIVGTPDYIAPEILLGESEDQYLVDWWSVGVIIYEMIVGIPPFNAETVEKVFDNIKQNRIEWPPIGNIYINE